MMDQQKTPHDTQCPRCGYDLRGTIETWKRECPIHGICNECGLEFEWGELLCLRRAVPRWCVEYARGWGGIAIASLKTVLVMLWPRKFWRDLKMVHEPRWGRFLVLGLQTLILLYLVLACTTGYNTYKEFRSLQQDLIDTPFMPEVYGLYATIYPFSKYSFNYTRTSGANTWNQSTRPPRAYANLPRPSRFWRELIAQIRSNQFTPFRARLRMSVVITQGFMLVVTCPLAFLFLPLSLRQSKVRWRHLIRIALYSSLILTPILGILIRNEMYSMSYFYWWLPDWIIPASLIYLLLAMTIWWSLAAKHYLKLPHAWGVGVSMVILAYVGGLFLVSLIDFVMM